MSSETGFSNGLTIPRFGAPPARLPAGIGAPSNRKPIGEKKPLLVPAAAVAPKKVPNAVDGPALKPAGMKALDSAYVQTRPPAPAAGTVPPTSPMVRFGYRIR